MTNAYVIYKNDTGFVVEFVTYDTPPTPYDNHSVVQTDVQYARGCQYAVVDGLVVTLKAQPSRNHVWDGTAWVEPPVDLCRADQEAKILRNVRLQESDWTQLPDVPLATKEVWAIYRQALRDITLQSGFPLEVTWPVAPV